MTAPSLDPAELAALEDERDHLLASLEDLEREHDAGDLDDADHAALKDDYTVRAAEVLRAIDGHRTVVEDRRPPTSRVRVLAVTAVVLGVAGIAGVMVAGAAGQRGGGTLTGNDNGLREQLATCQPVAFQDPPKGVDCYQDILDEVPDNVPALTYQGWALIRSDQVQEGAEKLARAVELDPDYPDARVFRAVVLARAGEAAARSGDSARAAQSFGAAAEELERFHRNDPSEVAVQVLAQEGLERKVFFGLMDAATLQCWQDAASTSTGDGGIDQAFLDALGTCLDVVLAASPSSADAQLSRALAHIGPDRQDAAAATALVEAILEGDPDAATATGANALLLRASLALVDGRFDAAQADLAVLEGGAWPSASFLTGTPEQFQAALEVGRKNAASGGSSVSTVPGAPGIPNPGGG